MRRQLILRIQRLFAVTILLLILAISLLLGQSLGLIPEDLWTFVTPVQLLPAPVMVISGHAGNDSGAVCSDGAGTVLLTEAEINARVAELVVQRLRSVGIRADVLEEYDPRLEDLRAPLVLSLHADSCVTLSGYKAAHRSEHPLPADDALLACIDEHYPAATGLPHHPNTITHDMTAYHAFRRIHPSTPAAILEMGFLGGDRTLLTDGAEQVAAGVTTSIRCFLDREKRPGD